MEVYTDRVKALGKKKGAGNGICFSCSQTGANYVALAQDVDLAVFICSTCAGVQRELGHRVKGISLSSFKEEEAAFLERRGGNRAQRPVWWAFFDAAKDGIPKALEGNPDALKRLLEMLYVQRRWHADAPGNRGRTPLIRAEAGDAPSRGSRGSVTADTGGFDSFAAPAPVATTSDFDFAPAPAAWRAPAAAAVVIDDPFGFGGAPAAAPAPARSSAALPPLGARAGTTARTGGGLAAPPAVAPSGAAAARLRSRGNTGGSHNSAGHAADAALQALDSYYGTDAPGPAPVVADDAFGGGFLPGTPGGGFGGGSFDVQRVPAAAPGVGGGWADFGASPAPAAPPAASGKADLFASLAGLYAAGPPAGAASVAAPQPAAFAAVPAAVAADPFGVFGGAAGQPPQLQPTPAAFAPTAGVAAVNPFGTPRRASAPAADPLGALASAVSGLSMDPFGASPAAYSPHGGAYGQTPFTTPVARAAAPPAPAPSNPFDDF
jgi:hypothetical protein